MSTISDNVTQVDHYSGIAKFLHWTVAVCVLAIIAAGLTMNNVDPGTLQNILYTVHRSLGVLVLFLMLIRLVYRLMHGAPPHEPTLTAMQRMVSHAVHMALYVLLIAQPIIGWVATSAYGAKISFFGLFTLPDLVAKDQALSEPLFAVHMWMGLLIAALAAMHIAAALFHHFILKDGVLRRMMR